MMQLRKIILIINSLIFLKFFVLSKIEFSESPIYSSYISNGIWKTSGLIQLILSMKSSTLTDKISSLLKISSLQLRLLPRWSLSLKSLISPSFAFQLSSNQSQISIYRVSLCFYALFYSKTFMKLLSKAITLSNQLYYLLNL